jgi:hypothetical protein
MNFRCNDALAEFYTLEILASIENKNSNLKWLLMKKLIG